MNEMLPHTRISHEWDGKTVREARHALSDTVLASRAGMNCPVCGQIARIYRRRLGPGEALFLMALAEYDVGAWVHVTELRNTDLGKRLATRTDTRGVQAFKAMLGGASLATKWRNAEGQGLVEALYTTKITEDEDGRAVEVLVQAPGVWRLSEHGRRFVNNSLEVMKYVYIYDNQGVGSAGEMVNLHRTLMSGSFDYRELVDW